MKNVLEYLEKSAEKYPQKVVFSECEKGNKEVTYSDFVVQCKKVASAISTVNIVGESDRNNPIAVFDNRNINTLVAMYGVIYSGNYYVVLDPKSPVERIQKIVDTLKPVCFVYEENDAKIVDALKIGVAKKLEMNTALQSPINEQFLKTQREHMVSTDPAYALFTSGSTGVPKGTICSHLNVISYVNWFIEAFDYDDKTVSANQMSFYFSGSIPDVFATTFAGATLHIVPKSYFTFVIQLANFLNEKKVNSIYWVPSALCIIANMKLFDYAKPQYLKKVLFIGEIMPNKQLNYWRKNIPDAMYSNLYGPTEVTDACTYYVVDREFADDESLPIGKHCNNCDTFLVDDDGKEVKEVGKVGELYARGAFVAFGYFDNPEKTAAAFVQNPLHNHYPEIVYRTGDLVKLNEFGEYIFVGRRDFQIKHMGYRIELGEIETAAGSIDKVNANVCIYDGDKDLIVMVYEGRVKEEELGEILKAKVPNYMVPNIIIKVKQMPYNANGKIDRTFLKANYKQFLNKEN